MPTNDDRDATFDDPRLFGGDVRERLAQELLVVHVDRCDDRQAWCFHDIGRVEPSAQAHLKQGHVSGGVGERGKGGGGRDLKIGDRVGAVGLQAAVEDF